jgi:hypothetical protein
MKKDEYDKIYGYDEEDSRSYEESEGFCLYELDHDYDDVYDEDGDGVYCDLCNSEIGWKDGQYICTGCGRVIDRDVFFNYIGAEPPGNECATCNNLYPGCLVCPHGYVQDD